MTQVFHQNCMGTTTSRPPNRNGLCNFKPNQEHCSVMNVLMDLYFRETRDFLTLDDIAGSQLRSDLISGNYSVVTQMFATLISLVVTGVYLTLQATR